MNRVWCDLALVDGEPQADVAIDIVDGRFASIVVNAKQGDATRLAGLTMPGLANAHSHAFQRALRSRTQADRGTFWTWRELMYRAAVRLQPDSYNRLARAVFAEMAMAGVSCVGEFHYIHHHPDGTPYDDPNEMGRALLAAADEAGIRITLLDTLYLHGGLDGNGHSKVTSAQRRFSDGSADVWAARVALMQPSDSQRIGAAIHSVRAVDAQSMVQVEEWASSLGAPVHAHVSEQTSENEACHAHYGTTPVAVFAEAGLLGERFSAIHATHLTDGDIDQLGASGSTVVMCPTTERDLGDGLGPTREFAELGIPITLGSDSHAVIDLIEEARAVELDERLRSRERGVHSASDLLAMASVNGHRSLGWDDAGAIAVGKRADLVTVALNSVRTVGIPSNIAVEATVFAATASDITDVYVDGQIVVKDGRHATIDVSAELDVSIKELMDSD